MYAGAKRETWLGVPMALRFLSYKGLVSSDLLDDKALLNCKKKKKKWTMRERTRRGTEVMSHLSASFP